jgi:hypothetical protein
MRYLVICLLALHILSSCGGGGIDRVIEPESVEVSVHRIDEGIMGNESDSILHLRLQKDYPEFYPLYFSDILQLGDVRSPSAHEQLELFRSDPIMRDLHLAIDSLLDIEEEGINEQLRDALGRYAAMFPDSDVPEVYLMNTGFNYGIYPIRDVLGVGAEFYLGAEHSMLQGLPPDLFPGYVRNKMKPEHLVPNALRGMLLVRLQQRLPARSLLDHMVFYGKVMYILDLMLPNRPEEQQFSFTEDEYYWCTENRSAIWRAMVKEELLYETDRKTLSKWLDRGPFTQGFPEDSPGELGIFLGKEMVIDFMEDNPEVSPAELVDIPVEQVLEAFRP